MTRRGSAPLTPPASLSYQKNSKCTKWIGGHDLEKLRLIGFLCVHLDGE